MDPIDMMVADLNCEDLGLSSLCLMENAGKCLSDEVFRISKFSFSKPLKVAIFTGSGGNGGDGFVAARHLLNRGFAVEVFMLTSPTDIKSIDALVNFEILGNMVPRFSRLKIIELYDSSDVEIVKSRSFSDYIIVDGILGTGIRGSLRERVKKAIELINDSDALKLSVDVPSGMDPLTGEVPDIAVKPDYTVTFHKSKSGVKKAHWNDESSVGDLVICDIGVPIEAEILVGRGDLLRLNSRKNTSHKGNNGKILVVGGSKDYHGAPIIAGLSALASGVDLVYIACPESVSLAIKQESPDLIVKGLNTKKENDLNSDFISKDYLGLDNLEDVLKIIDDTCVDAVLLGPGSGQNEETGRLFNSLVKMIKIPLVIDADALKLVDLKIIENKEDLIMTPHLNEFKLFFDSYISDYDKISLISDSEVYDYIKLQEKVSIFQGILSKVRGTVVLKGQYDLIFNKNSFRINKAGNSGMTVGGTGDSLAGLATSLISHGLSSYDAGALAAYLNGKSGDLAKEKYGNGFVASQLYEFLGLIMMGIDINC